MKLHYLAKPEFYQYDEELFDVLLNIVSGQTRTVNEIKKSKILGDAVFYAESVPDRRKRHQWLSQALEDTRGTKVVFLDPDNGLDPCEMDDKDKLSQKHVYLNEVRPFVKRGQTVVIYQSYQRRKGDTAKGEVLKWRNERLTELELDEHPRVVGTSDRAFIVLPATPHVEHIDRRLRSFVERWGEHFKHQALDPAR